VSRPGRVQVEGLRLPHARVYQRELQRLIELDAKASHIAVIAALRARLDARTQDTRDGVESIARYAGLSESSTRRAIQWLVAQRIVDEQPAQPVKGGRKGAAWAWPRRVRAFDAWGQEGVMADTSWQSRPRTLEELQAIKASGRAI
jgi:site-specific recombinase XerC